MDKRELLRQEQTAPRGDRTLRGQIESSERDMLSADEEEQAIAFWRASRLKGQLWKEDHLLYLADTEEAGLREPWGAVRDLPPRSYHYLRTGPKSARPVMWGEKLLPEIGERVALDSVFPEGVWETEILVWGKRTTYRPEAGQ